jgi:ATP-grasp domain-containing protein
VAEPVNFLVEYRCFIVGLSIAAISPYRRFEQLFDETRPSMNEPSTEIAEAEAFASMVVTSPDVACPPAFVLDVGLIEGRGWAVVEANECWASGIYHCDPMSVLQVLRQACIPDRPRTEAHERWDFAEHYARAVPR